MIECDGDGDGATTDSGSAAIVSSADELSIVICLVGGGAFRVV